MIRFSATDTASGRPLPGTPTDLSESEALQSFLLRVVSRDSLPMEVHHTCVSFTVLDSQGYDAVAYSGRPDDMALLYRSALLLLELRGSSGGLNVMSLAANRQLGSRTRLLPSGTGAGLSRRSMLAVVGLLTFQADPTAELVDHFSSPTEVACSTGCTARLPSTTHGRGAIRPKPMTAS